MLFLAVDVYSHRGVLSDHSVEYLNRFTRQNVAYDLSHNRLLAYFNNSQLVEQAIKAAYIDSSPLSDDDHIGWAKVEIQVRNIFTNSD